MIDSDREAQKILSRMNFFNLRQNNPDEESIIEYLSSIIKKLLLKRMREDKNRAILMIEM
jgi:hypothetical protein